MRKTKIVCTIGPAVESLDKLKAIIEAGCDVARLNFSHGTHQEHEQRIRLIRQAAEELGVTVGILLDTKGPEIRTRDVEDGAVELVQGEKIILTSDDILGNADKISITYPDLHEDVDVGSMILIDDGLIELKVDQIKNHEIHCTIINGGTLKNKKGVNVPGVSVNLPGITDKDADDIRFGILHQVDFIAASFVRKAADIYEIRRILEAHQADIHIIAKIENEEGVLNADEIIEVSDGVMVARGDLGVEIPAEDVPLIQKELIRKCNLAGKPVITATQMLDSMQRNPRPTRAEASDVANAILDGTDAIMLSGETAAGKYPIESVQTMAQIARRTETSLDAHALHPVLQEGRLPSITNVISEVVSHSASELQATAILALTESGFTARTISKYRPNTPVIAITPHAPVMRKLQLVWGVHPLLGGFQETTDELMQMGVEVALEKGFVNRGDLIVITAGVPLRESGTTNLVKIHVIGDVIARGQGIGQHVVTGNVVIVENNRDLNLEAIEGKIIVTHSTDKEMVHYIEHAKAVITEEGGLTSHAAIVGLNLGIPVVVGIDNVLEVFQDGMEITVDSKLGHIYSGQTKVL